MGIALGAAAAWPTKRMATARTIDLQEKNILDGVIGDVEVLALSEMRVAGIGSTAKE